METDKVGLADFIEPGVHGKTGAECLFMHGDESGDQPCIKCRCGKWVRPHDWKTHLTPPR